MAEQSATGDWRATVAELSADRPIVPGYEIVEEIGRGGMGVVYKARQTATKEMVALKLIRDAALATPQEYARFRIESEAAARLDHPNVVRIHAVGEHRGQPYFAMELVEGSTLAGFLAGRPQPAMPSATLLRTIALAIQHAHDARVIHRDLKPANILLVGGGVVSDDSSDGTTHHSPLSTFVPKVTDFGLAKRLDTDSTALTHDGAILGTASYMAPEQAAGRVREIGPATDVYALGAILYEMLTGRPPFHGETWNQTIQQVLNDEPTPPSRMAVDTPRDLETVCLKCLEKSPERRYASARELADELDRVLSNRPVAAQPLEESERLARLAARDGLQIVAEIGRGPRGVVYRAFDGPLKQPVALKVYPEGTCSRDEWDARVRRFGELGPGLGHPGIVAVKRAGWWSGVPYLVEEYAPQGSLAAQLFTRPQPVATSLKLIEQLAEIISYVHRQGIVHGNLKPNNVLFAADGIPRLADFRPPVGLVAPPPPTDASDPADLSYLAPELLANEEVEPRLHTDIYGLGAILYRLLAGRAPFEAATAAETMERIRTAEPVPLPQLNRDVSSSLDAFCRRCLNQNPWWRFSRVYDVLKRLQHYQEHPVGGDVRDRRPQDFSMKGE